MLYRSTTAEKQLTRAIHVYKYLTYNYNIDITRNLLNLTSEYNFK